MTGCDFSHGYIYLCNIISYKVLYNNNVNNTAIVTGIPNHYQL